ncbi:MAG: radical SAM family heme chaperone HemW [Pseudomonadota bacterium]
MAGPETIAPPTGLYIHWPFCDRICPYCDFTVARNRNVDEKAWQDALLSDMAFWAECAGTRSLTSLYFGGGTPSLMSPSLVAALVEGAGTYFRFDENIEITLETNPTDAEHQKFQAFRDAGVNRLSLGVQSFDDGQLAFLGRNHNGISARLAVEAAVSTFSHVTFDLIYALPGEGTAAWRRRLESALSIGAAHMSLYQLTVEAGTAFDKAVARGAWSPPDEDLSADLYALTGEVMAGAGMPAYEVSNYARPTARAVHNSLYWHGHDWLGIGPGAHGRLQLGGERCSTVGRPAPTYYTSLLPHERFEIEALNQEAVVTERIAGGLRPVEGVRWDEFPSEVRSRFTSVRAELVESGLLVDRPDRIQATSDGRLLIDYIIKQFVLSL